MITVNGKKCELSNNSSLESLIKHLKLENELCAVEINKILIPFQERTNTIIKDGDEIEIVSIVGGG